MFLQFPDTGYTCLLSLQPPLSYLPDIWTLVLVVTLESDDPVDSSISVFLKSLGHLSRTRVVIPLMSSRVCSESGVMTSGSLTFQIGKIDVHLVGSG